MNRRDTIIVAVLVNAALLMILFATAVHSDEAEKSDPVPTKLVQNTPKIDLPRQEEILSQYIHTVPPVVEIPEVIEKPAKSTVAADNIAAVKPLPVKPAPAKEDSTPYVNVTVKKGDFLEKIAKANGTSVQMIMKANNLSNTQLKVGQVLKIPLSSEQKIAMETPPPSSSSIPSSQPMDFYTVKEGDNPWLIASRNHLKLEELLKLNELDEQKARKLRPGDRLRIR